MLGNSTTATTPPATWATCRHYDPGIGGGVRSDLEWSRPGQEPARPGISSRDLVRAVQYGHLRRGREWGDTDEATRLELQRRAWGYGEAQRRRWWTQPTWLDWLPSRRGSGYLRIVGLAIAAYRAGACGLLLSYEEACSLCDVSSRSTWARWLAELEGLGVLRAIQTWEPDREHRATGRRRYGRLLYLVGPELQRRAGPALLEGAPGLSQARQRWAARAGACLRSSVRAARRERKRALWCRKHQTIKSANGPETGFGSRPEGVGAVRLLDPTPLPPAEGSSAPRSAEAVGLAAPALAARPAKPDVADARPASPDGPARPIDLRSTEPSMTNMHLVAPEGPGRAPARVTQAPQHMPVDRELGELLHRLGGPLLAAAFSGSEESPRGSEESPLHPAPPYQQQTATGPTPGRSSEQEPPPDLPHPPKQHAAPSEQSTPPGRQTDVPGSESVPVGMPRAESVPADVPGSESVSVGATRPEAQGRRGVPGLETSVDELDGGE